MSALSAIRQPARVALHVGGARLGEVLVLQASPLLGAVLGASCGGRIGIARLALLLVGSTLLTAHVFVFNDWAGRAADLNDPRRADTTFAQHGIGSRDVARLSVALLALAMATLAALGFFAVALGAAIACLGVVYSDSFPLAKGVPVVGSLLHVVGGALHFLLGYSVARAVDTRGLLIALFFGLVFAGGHLNQEVRDREGDLRNGIRTSAVVFGARRTFIASVLVFTAAYAELVLLAGLDVVPRALLWSSVLWLLHLGFSLHALRRGLGFERARWMQLRYRALFAIVGVAMGLATLAAPAGGRCAPPTPALHERLSGANAPG